MTYIYPTPKQETIINYIYQFRFLNRIQIQTLMHHKDYKRINAWLKELTEENFLGRIYSKRLLENTKPAIYYLSGKGIKFMHERHKISKEQLKKYLHRYIPKLMGQEYVTLRCYLSTRDSIKTQDFEKGLWEEVDVVEE